jgi:hypothetical protein
MSFIEVEAIDENNVEKVVRTLVDVNSVSTVLDMSDYAESMKMPNLRSALVGKNSDGTMYLTNSFDELKLLFGLRA